MYEGKLVRLRALRPEDAEKAVEIIRACAVMFRREYQTADPELMVVSCVDPAE